MGAVERKIAAWVDLAGDLLTHPTGQFPRHVLEQQLYETSDCQVSWNWMDRGIAPGFTLHVPVAGWPPPPEALRDMSDAIGQHPLIRWFATTRDMTAMSIGRVPSGLITPVGRAVIRDHLAATEMDQQLSIPYRMGPGRHRAFVLARTGHDFSAEELEAARQIQPLLRLLDRQCRALRRDAVMADHGALSGREVAVLRLLADGLTASAIGRHLAISHARSTDTSRTSTASSGCPTGFVPFSWPRTPASWPNNRRPTDLRKPPESARGSWVRAACRSTDWPGTPGPRPGQAPLTVPST